jgi:hypothetical protein
MSMPNYNSLHDYDRFNPSLQQQQQQPMNIGSIGGTPATSPGPWTRSDPQQLMGSTLSTTINDIRTGSTNNSNSNNSNYIQGGLYRHSQDNQHYQHSINSTSNNLMLNSLGDLSLGHVPVSFDTATKNNGPPLFDTIESQFSFHLDDDVPFRMDDVSESSPMPIGLSSQTPSAMTTITTLSASSNELNSTNVIGSPIISNELSSRLTELHLDANVQTTTGSLNPWS